jgi:PAS domain S-box-containing protein
VARAVERGVEYRAEGRLWHAATERYRYVSVRAVPLFGATGGVVEWIGTVSDIHERRVATEALARSERQLRDVLDGLTVFVGLVSPDGVLLEANRAALESAGLEADDVIGQPYADTYWWAHSVEVQGKLRDAIARAAGGERVRFDVEARLGPDRFVIIDFTMSPMFDDTGTVTFLVPSGIDITDRLATQRALRESEQRASRKRREIETLYRTAPVGLGVVDGGLRFLRVNERWRRSTVSRPTNTSAARSARSSATWPTGSSRSFARSCAPGARPWTTRSGAGPEASTPIRSAWPATTRCSTIKAGCTR